LQTLLDRRRFAEAADAWLSLPSAERGSALDVVVAGAQVEIDQAFTQRSQSSLVVWVTRAEREPRLAAALNERARFALFAAALRARMWPQAERLWAALRLGLQGQAEFTGPFLAAIDAVVNTRGAPDPVVVHDLLSQDTRLGHDVVRPRIHHAAPRELEEVEPACLACFGSERWSRFREVVTSWLHQAGPEVSQALRSLSMELSERELLLRARAGTADASEVARFMATCALDAGAPAELEPQIAQCLRVSARVASSPGAAAKSCEALAAVATAALRYPALHGFIAESLLAVQVDALGSATRRELLRIAIAADDSPAVLVRVAIELHVHQLHAPEEGDCPGWYAAAFEAALTTPNVLAAELSKSVANAEMSQRANPCAEPCHALLEVLPVPLAVAAVDRLWDHVSEALRVRLGQVSELLLDRMRAPALDPADLEPADLRRLLAGSELEDTPDAALKAVLSTRLGRQLLEELTEEESVVVAPIAHAYDAEAHTLLNRVAAYHPVALAAALARVPASDKAEVRRLARAHLARADTLLGRYRVIARAVRADCETVLLPLEAECCEGIVPHAADAAAALTAAEHAAPLRLRNRFARLLLEALEREPEALAQLPVARAAALARRRVGRKKPRAKTTKKPTAASAPTKTASALKKRAANSKAGKPNHSYRDDPSRKEDQLPLQLQFDAAEEARAPDAKR